MTTNEGGQMAEQFGKHYGSMYTGSMVGAGAMVFALMGYVVANQKPCPDGKFRVELNPKLLSLVIGETEECVCEALGVLCEKDGESRTADEGGRRLVREGQFLYRVVNGAKYRLLGMNTHRQQSNRMAVAKYREKKRKERVQREGGGGSGLRERLAARGEGPMPGDEPGAGPGPVE